MTSAPRIVGIVHGRYEDDPRVSRHLAAAYNAGYRVAALCVVPQATRPRWSDIVHGVCVYESQSQRSLMGRVRAMLQRAVPATHGSDAQAHVSAGDIVYDRTATTIQQQLLGAARDVVSVALLLRHNVGLFRQFRGLGGRVVHANDLNVLPAAYLLARYWHAQLIYDSHELWLDVNPSWSPLFRRLLRALEGFLIRRADHVITVNRAVALELSRRYRITEPTVIMNCPPFPETLVVSPDRPHNPQTPARAVYLGMINAGRGLLELLDAAVAVPGLALTLQGPGPLRERIQTTIDALQLGDRVRLLPSVPVEQVVTTLADYHIGVIPYPSTSLNTVLSSPVKLFEYMAAGLAVVASDLPVIREIVESAECGLLVAPGDHHALAHALDQLTNQADLRTRLGQNGQRAAQDRYNAAHEELRLLALYSSLAARSRS